MDIELVRAFGEYIITPIVAGTVAIVAIYTLFKD